jgi:hypothetical protein
MKTLLFAGICAISIVSATASLETRSARLPPLPSTPCTSNNVGDQQETLITFNDGTGYYASYKCVYDNQGNYFWELLGFSPCLVGPRGCIKI